MIRATALTSSILGRGTPQPFVIGITGAIGSGKSTVSRMLQSKGAEVLDADAIYRSMLKPGSPLASAIANRFGPSVVCADGSIDRAILGSTVFSDPRALRDLERITHPAVVKEIRSRLAMTRAPVVVIEAIKLVQSGLLPDVDSLWLVTAGEESRTRRLVEQRRLAPDAAALRVAAQREILPAGVEPDVIIDNSGDRDKTGTQVKAEWTIVMEVLRHRREAQ